MKPISRAEVEHPAHSQNDNLVSLLPVVLFPHHLFLSVLNLPRILYPYTLLPYYPQEELEEQLQLADRHLNTKPLPCLATYLRES